MSNKALSDIATAALNFLKRIKQHVGEIMSPDTPSYKTSASAIPFFILLAATAGERQSLFWIAMTGTLFFTTLAISQYGFLSKSKRNNANSSNSSSMPRF